MEFQTRSSKTDIRFHETLEQALNFAQEDGSVWKISFTIPETQERVRLVREETGWTLETVFGERHIGGR